MIACDCHIRSRIHMMENAHFLELVDPGTHRLIAEEERGSIYISCLHKYAAPVIHFNVNDISTFTVG